MSTSRKACSPRKKACRHAEKLSTPWSLHARGHDADPSAALHVRVRELDDVSREPKLDLEQAKPIE
jgi:hypothetical protein